MHPFKAVKCFLAFALLLLLSACVTTPKHLAYDRDAAGAAKRVVVLTMRRSEINLLIVNNPGYSFGLIGLAIAEANRAPKVSWLQAQVARDHFDYLAEFHDDLTAAMAARGYELRWSDPIQVPEKGKDVDRENFGLRKSYASISEADAQLDVNFGFIGYAAAGSRDSSPYRPTVIISARLLSADGKRVLFEDMIAYNNVFSNVGNPITIEPDNHYLYPEFNALQNAGSEATWGLKAAFRATAEELAKQF